MKPSKKHSLVESGSLRTSPSSFSPDPLALDQGSKADIGGEKRVVGDADICQVGLRAARNWEMGLDVVLTDL